MALKTRFMLHCDGFADEDLPLTYAFSYSDTSQLAGSVPFDISKSRGVFMSLDSSNIMFSITRTYSD